MKPDTAWDDLLGASTRRWSTATLYTPAGVEVDTLPVFEGSVRAETGRGAGRWSGALRLAGDEWAPTSADHPLSPLSAHYVEITMHAQTFDSPTASLLLARLWPVDTTVTVGNRADTEIAVRLESPSTYAYRAGPPNASPIANETVQAMAVRLLTRALPNTPTVTDTTTPVPVPASFDWEDRPLFLLVLDLLSLADAVAYFDHLGNLTIRPALPSLDVQALAVDHRPPLSPDLDLIEYRLQLARTLLANDVVARYRGTDGQLDGRVGTAQRTTGPLAVTGPAGQLTLTVDRQVTATQAQADAYAASVLTATEQAWALADIEAMPDPRLEPDDLIDVDYVDGRRLRHRIIGCEWDLGHRPMRLTARTALPAT